MFWLRKLVSPAGVGLMFLLFFLPFIGVACESGAGKVEAEISGWDMVIGGEPAVSGTGVFGEDGDSDQELPDDVRDGVPVQPVMVVLVLTLIATAGLSLVPLAARTRMVIGAVGFGAALFLVVVNQIVATDDLVSELVGSSPSEQDLDEANEFVGTRVGFWLTLFTTVALLAWHVVDLVSSRRQQAPQPPWQGPPHG